MKIYCEFYRLQFCRDFWNISSSSTVLVDHTQFYQFAVMFGFCILINKINNFETYTYRAISHPVNVILSFWIIVAFILLRCFHQPPNLCPLVHLNCHKCCKYMHQYTQVHFLHKYNFHYRHVCSCKIRVWGPTKLIQNKNEFNMMIFKTKKWICRNVNLLF